LISHYRYIAYTTLQIAKGSTPIDTGNLRHNAIFLKDFRVNKDGATWRINYSSRNANYIDPLNYGWNKPNGGKVRGRFFIETATLNISRYIKGQLTNNALNSFRDNVSNTTDLKLEERKLIYNKSVELTEQGKVTPSTQTTQWDVRL
jgi:hypothetical protein